MAETTEITKVQIIIRKFLHETKDVVKDAEKSQKWLESFRDTLQYQDLEEYPNEFAMEILREAKAFNELQRKNSQFKNVRKILAENGVNNPTRSQIEQKWAEIYGNGDNGAVAVVAPKVVDEDSHRTAAASLAYSGQNGLVRLSDDEYNVLLQKIGNKRKADKLIDDLDYAIAEGKTFKQPHLHVLTHWQSYREDKAEEAAETAKARAAANAEAFGNVDRRTPYQKNQDDLLRLYQETSAALKAM
jgi:hypothetical protein